MVREGWEGDLSALDMVRQSIYLITGMVRDDDLVRIRQLSSIIRAN